MKKIKRIAVIGGTGKSGKYLINQLLKQGYPIKVLVRKPERFQINYPLAEVIIGDVNDNKVLQSLICDCDVIISALGLGVPPSSPTIFSQATKNIIKTMNDCGVRRYILLTGLNVDAPFDKKGIYTKSATEWMYANFPKSTADRQLEYQILQGSGIDWTLVRLPLIEQTETTGKIMTCLEDCPGDKISATDLAIFLIGQLTDISFIKKAPFIANVQT